MKQEITENGITPFTTEELLILLNASDESLSKKMKLQLLEQLVQQYFPTRGFNLYLEVINAFYVSSFAYYLGKTSLQVERDMAKTIRIIDLLAKYEVESNSDIPEEHAKYFFALAKEFVTEIDDMVVKQKFNGDFKRLVQQLDWLKQIMMKSKNYADVVTIFETAIRHIEKANPLLLEGKVENSQLPAAGKLTLTVPLYKMTKQAFKGVLESLYLYRAEDFYKIVEFALTKHGHSVFSEAGQSSFAAEVALLTQKLPKVNMKGFAPHLYFWGKTHEDLQTISYYPLSCEDIDGYYLEFSHFVKHLVQNQKITGEEQFYLEYAFLKSTRQLSPGLAKKFLHKAEIYLGDITSKLSSVQHGQLSAMFEETYTLTYLDELVLMGAFGDSPKGRKRFGFDVVNGEIVPSRKGHTKWLQNRLGYNDKEVPREDVTTTQYQIIWEIQRSIIDAVAPLLKNQEMNSFERLRDWVHLYQSDLLEDIEIDFEPKEELESLRWHAKEVYLTNLLKARMESGKLTEKELVFLVKTNWLAYGPFHEVDSEVVLQYIKTACEKGLLNLYLAEDQAKIFKVKIINPKMKQQFIYDMYEKVEPTVTASLSALVSTDENEDVPFFTRRNELVSRFFGKKLKHRGYDVEGIIF